MARPRETGLSYYPLEIGFLRDDKIVALRTACGSASPLVIQSIWGRMYESEGPIELNKAVRAGVCWETGVTAVELDAIVSEGIELGLFYWENARLYSLGVNKRLEVITRERDRLRGKRKQTTTNSEQIKGEGEPIENRCPTNTNEFQQTPYSVSLSLLDLSLDDSTTKDRSTREVGGVGGETQPENPPELKPKPQKRPPGWRDGAEEVRPGVWLKPEELKKLREKAAGEGEAEYLIEQMAMAAENKNLKFLRAKNHYLTAISWRDIKRSDGKEWDELGHTYRRSWKQRDGPKTAAQMAYDEALALGES